MTSGRAWAAAAGAAAMMALTPATALAAPAGGPSGAVRTCLDGGYTTVVGTSGPFATTADCARYAGQGGALYPKHPSLHNADFYTGTKPCVHYTGGVCDQWDPSQLTAQIEYSGFGWVPGSHETGTLTIGSVTYPLSVSADGNGNFVADTPAGLPQLPFTLTLTNAQGQTATISQSLLWV